MTHLPQCNNPVTRALHQAAALLLAMGAAACASSGADPDAGRRAPQQVIVAAAPADQDDHDDHSDHTGHRAGSHHAMGDLAPVSIPPGALFTEADVRFMQGMIAHHAQAIVMTRMAGDAGASPRVLKLAQKIDLSQAGEIALMQDWLHVNGQVVTDTSSWRTMQMHGMLTAAEIASLAAARGTEFDRLFLTLMIHHHEGALQMVAELLASPRAAQDVDVNVLANEVEATQMAEIALMWQMIADLD